MEASKARGAPPSECVLVPDRLGTSGHFDRLGQRLWMLLQSIEQTEKPKFVSKLLLV
jgi:hypothetical protein